MIISHHQVQNATHRAVAGFREVGLNTGSLHECEVVSIPFGGAFGYCEATGEIQIPRVSLSRIGERIRGSKRTSLVDVIRHEMAHALAFSHPHLVKNARFRRVFGASHDLEKWPPDRRPDYWEEDFVSGYATTNPGEDFAETVMFFVKHCGDIDRYYEGRYGVWEKLAFVGEMAEQIQREGIPLA